MATIILQLDPSLLSNPDLDIRYKLPELLIDRSGGRLSNGGYDYVGDGRSNRMQLFLLADDTSVAIPAIIEVLKSERVLGNDLSEVPIAVEDEDEFRVVYPVNFNGEFHRSDG